MDTSRVQDVAGTSQACALALVPELSQLVWFYPATDRRIGHRVPWLLVIGERLLDQLIVGSYGEERYCRFLESLTHDGVAPVGSIDAKLPDWIGSVANEIDERPAAYRVRVRSLITDIVLALYRGTMSSDPRDPRTAIAFSELIDHIELHYDEHLELEGLARMMDTSPTHLSRVFRREVGVPLFEYINQTRVRKACLLLRRTDFPVTRIAIDVGYNNISHFNRYFRKLMHCSPREYRRDAAR